MPACLIRGRSKVFSVACVLLFSAMAVAQAAAQSYPVRPIRLIVPFPPGGSNDIVGRLLGLQLGERLGRSVIIDNRAGAGGNLGIDIAAKSAPDGYTMLMVSAAFAFGPSMYQKLPFDPVKSFTPVAKIGAGPNSLAVFPGLPVKTAKDLIALAKAKPGQLNFTSAGTGSATHFGGEMFKASAGIDIVHVPLKGIPEALTEVMTGRVHYFMAPFGSSAGLIRDGRLRALAVTSAQRTRMNPEIPTIAESGLPGFRYDSWGALFAPAKTPRAVINRLNREVAAALKLPENEQRLHAVGMEPAPGTPAELDRFVVEQLKAAHDLARGAGLKPE
jgi:tripartite-type tricarboxylate transporter receptor subunit TctC